MIFLIRLFGQVAVIVCESRCAGSESTQRCPLRLSFQHSTAGLRESTTIGSHTTRYVIITACLGVTWLFRPSGTINPRKSKPPIPFLT